MHEAWAGGLVIRYLASTFECTTQVNQLGHWMGLGPVACSRVADVNSNMSTMCQVKPIRAECGYIKRKFYTQLLKVILAFLAQQVVTSDPAPYESRLRQAVNQSQKSYRILQNRQPSSLETSPVAPKPSFYEI